MVLPVVPEQMVSVLVAGLLLKPISSKNPTASVLAALVPQVLVAVTVILSLPAVPDVTVIEFVPVPAVIDHPEGTVQLYTVVPGIAVTL